MIVLQALWGRIWPYVAAVGAILVGILGIRQSGKSAGKAELQQELDRAILQGMKNAKKSTEEIDAMDDAAIRDRAIQRLRDNSKR